MYTVNLIVGDWSDDGHGKVTMHSFITNLTPDQVRYCHSVGATPAQHVVLDTIASDYEDTVLTPPQLEVLKQLGFPVEKLAFNEEKEEPNITEDEYIELYWHVVSRGNPYLSPVRYTRVETNDITIGGYGFFS